MVEPGQVPRRSQPLQTRWHDSVLDAPPHRSGLTDLCRRTASSISPSWHTHAAGRLACPAAKPNRLPKHLSGRPLGACTALLAWACLLSLLTCASCLPADEDLYFGTTQSLSGAGENPRPGFLGQLEGHRSAIYALATSANGLLASGSKDRHILLWNLSNAIQREQKQQEQQQQQQQEQQHQQQQQQNKKKQRPFGKQSRKQKPILNLTEHEAGVVSLAFYGDNFLLSGSADNTTRLWDLATGSPKAILKHPRTVFGLSVQPPTLEFARGAQKSEPLIATACWDGVVRLWTLPEGALEGELRGHSAGLYSVSFSPLDGTLLASASADHTVRIWDVQTKEMLWTVHAHGDHVSSVDWSPKDRLSFSTGGWDRRFRLWEISNEESTRCRGERRQCQELVPKFTGRHPQLVWRVAYHPGGNFVAACHGAVGQSPTVVIYEVNSGQVVRRMGRHKDTPLTIAWALQSQVLASAGMDGKVLLYDGNALEDDLPKGDLDDADEQAQWKADLLDFRTSRIDAANATTSAQGNVSWTADQAQPHPLAGRVAFW